MSAGRIATGTGVAAPGERSSGIDPRIRTILVMAVTAVLVTAVAWYIDQPTGAGLTAVDIEAGPGGPPQAGQVPPDFDGVDVAGAAIRLTEFTGQPVWLTFGASWCGDCRAESPDLQATYARYAAQGLVVVGVFIEEDDAAVREYAERIGLTFRMIADPRDRIAAGYHILGIPTHYFIGRDGTIREVRLGGLQADEMDRLVQGILD